MDFISESKNFLFKGAVKVKNQQSQKNSFNGMDTNKYNKMISQELIANGVTAEAQRV